MAIASRVAAVSEMNDPDFCMGGTVTKPTRHINLSSDWANF
jgi:hypothetical protein